MKVLSFIILLVFSFLPLKAEVIKILDPAKMARAEVQTWKDYYNKNHFALLYDINYMIKLQYPVSDIDLWLKVTPKLAEALDQFKGINKNAPRSDYEKEVLPTLVQAYESLKQSVHANWDPELVARQDLEWWILRRQEKTVDPEAVGHQMVQLYYSLYGKNDDRHFLRASYLRAAAARYRDLCSTAWGGVKSEDWGIIEAILMQSYIELAAGIKANMQEV